MNPRLHETHTYFIGYSDILDIVIISPKLICPQRYHYIQYVMYKEIVIIVNQRSCGLTSIAGAPATGSEETHIILSTTQLLQLNQ